MPWGKNHLKKGKTMNAKFGLAVVALVFFAQLVPVVPACPPKKVVAVPPPYMKVEAFGNLKTDVVAIGGETTGYTLTIHVIKRERQVWELDLNNDPALILQAKKLNGQLAFVTGTAELRKHTERGLVPTIMVESLRSTEDFLRPDKKK